MKSVLVLSFVAALVLTGLPALAQDNDLIVLNDSTPVIDVVITLPPDTTGAIALDFASAAVTLTDAANAVVFSAADKRLHGLELSIAPNTGPHTLIVERLPGEAQAYVTIASMPELTINGAAEMILSDQVNLNQEVSFALDATRPGDNVAVNIPDNSTGLITATFPSANATTQLVDAQGMIVAASYNGHIDGLNLVLDGGQYDFALLATDFSSRVVTSIRALPAAENGIDILEIPTADMTTSSSDSDCTATITVSSVNLRSGPGTGYSVLGYGYRDDVLPVGGVHPAQNWVVVATGSDSAWLSNSVARLDGECDGLAVFDVPLRDAQPAPVIVVTPEPEVIIQSVPSNSSSNRSSNNRSDDDDDDDHDDDDEHDDDDD